MSKKQKKTVFATVCCKSFCPPTIMSVTISLLLLFSGGFLSAADYIYWQQTVNKKGKVENVFKLRRINADKAPSPENPLTVEPKKSDNAKEYRILRIPTNKPASPTVKVINPGKDTVYYWLVGHAGLFRSPIAGPAVAKNCDLSKLHNVISWQKTAPYQTYTLLRTGSPEPPSGVCNCMLVWGTGKTKIVDKNGLGVLSDYPCYPQGTGNIGNPPVGSGPFLVGISKGEPIKDTGKLQRTNVPPVRNCRQLPNPGGFAIFKSQNTTRKGVISFDIINDSPSGRYDWGGPVGLFIFQKDFAGGHNDYSPVYGGPHAKSFHVPLFIWQQNFTAGQVANQVIYSDKHGEGDNVIMTLHNNTDGLTEDGGDEGTEIFMCSATRKLNSADYVLQKDSPAQSTVLYVKGYRRAGTGRVLVNLSQSVKQGKIVRIDDDMMINPKLRPRKKSNRVTRLTGEDTNWTAEMSGWYISLDCDTTKKGFRQWYRIIRVNSPTSMDIFAYTYFSASTYMGHASNVIWHGKKYRGGIKHEPRPKPDKVDSNDGKESFLIAPATTIADSPGFAPNKINVMPLKQVWKKGEKIRLIAGPQNSLSIGKFGLAGEFLPQDYVHGLWIYNWGNRLSNDAALIVSGKWNTGLDIQLDGAGLSNGITVKGKSNPDGAALVVSPDTNALRVTDVPVVLAGRKESGTMVFAQSSSAGSDILAIGKQSVKLGDQVTLAAGKAVRGKAAFSGNGTRKKFSISFPIAFTTTPYVVASANLPIGMGVTAVEGKGFTVTFANPPAKGENNIEITWIVMQ